MPATSLLKHNHPSFSSSLKITAMGRNFSALLMWVALVLLFLAPSTAEEIGCTPETAGVDNGPATVRLKIAAFASILAAGALGVALPLIGKKFPILRQNGNLFFVVKAFAAGVILSTGLIHVLPDAFENLTSPCLTDKTWQEFPFAGFVAMMAAIFTLVIESIATNFYAKGKTVEAAPGDEENLAGHGEEVHCHSLASHGHHVHGAILPPLPKEEAVPEKIRHRVVSQVLELGIVVHSLIIGISLGASSQPNTIRPLIGALSFHQFFEGLGLGGCISQANFKGITMFLMALFFTLTTPLGVAVGMGVASKYDDNGDGALIVEGLLNAASAGILIYMALVDFLAADFMSPKLRFQCPLQLAAYLALFMGAGLMSLLAKWA